MCAQCGCGSDDVMVINMQSGRRSSFHVHADGTAHTHANGHHTHGHHTHDHRAYDHHARGQGDGVIIDVSTRLLAHNDDLAGGNRSWFAQNEILALNLVSAPGAGKTTLLECTIRELRGEVPIYVIEGDQATANDGARIRAAGARAVQINTGTGCHLDADMVARALKELRPSRGSLTLIENVGNLVCPAMFDLGERAKVAILSTAEGEDKPLKYPHMFQAATVVLLNKIDLLPHVDFDVDRAVSNARAVKPDITVFPVSTRTGEGLNAWYEWLRHEAAAVGASSRSQIPL